MKREKDRLTREAGAVKRQGMPEAYLHVSINAGGLDSRKHGLGVRSARRRGGFIKNSGSRRSKRDEQPSGGDTSLLVFTWRTVAGSHCDLSMLCW